MQKLPRLREGTVLQTAKKQTNLGKLKSLQRAAQLDMLAREHTLALKRFFSARQSYHTSTEDMVQDVFLRLAGRASELKIKNTEAYLICTALSVWHDHLRKQKTHVVNKHVEYSEQSHAINDFCPERIYIGKEEIDFLLNSLDGLPKRTRDVFILCRLKNMKQKDAAVKLGIATGSIYAHLIKAFDHIGGRINNTH